MHVKGNSRYDQDEGGTYRGPGAAGRIKYARLSMGALLFPKTKDKAYGDSLLPVSATKEQHDAMVA